MTDSSQIIHSFLHTLFGDNEGQVYAPTKGKTARSWVQNFFSYPARIDDIITHMQEANKAGKDVYIAPALFKTNENASKANWLGTQYLYVDFDGNAPSPNDPLPKGIPEPTMKVRSSVAGREHWYWKLDKFYTGHQKRKELETLAKSITYSFDADRSGWDSVQVLRAPGTKHRRTGATTSLLTLESDRVYSPASFTNVLPAPSSSIRLKTEEKNLPDVTTVLSRVVLSKEAQTIFNRTKEFMETVNEEGQKHDRSKALFRFARECIEVRPKIPNDDILALLNHLAYKWDKFSDRSDRFVQVKIVLQNAIALAPEKKVDEEVDDEYFDLRFLNIREMFAREVQEFEYIYDPFLARGTLNVLASLGGIGKTSFAMQMGMDAASKHRFLHYPFMRGDPVRNVMFSFEMPEQIFNKYTKEIVSFYDDEHKTLIHEHWKRSGLGYPIPLWDKKVQEYMVQQIDIHNSELIFIDSVKYAGGMDEKHGDLLFQWVKKELIAKRGLTVYFIHHIRKPTSERPNHIPVGLEDLYGDAYIGNIADSVTFLHKPANADGDIDVIPVKTRTGSLELPYRLTKVPNVFRYIRDVTVSSITDEEEPVAEERKHGLGTSFG